MSKIQIDASLPAKELRKEAAKRIAAKVTNREGFEEALKLRFALLEKVAALKDAVPSAQCGGTVQPYAGGARIYLK